MACYGDVESLVRDPNVDLVVVSVKTPEHYRLAKPALEGQKDVFVEWPLGANLKQAEELAALAKSQNVRNVIGLQARQAPAILKAKEMIVAGKLGDILGTTVSTMPCHRYASAPTVFSKVEEPSLAPRECPRSSS